MDYIDVLAIVIAAVFITVSVKFFPQNPLGVMGSYIKNIFNHKS